MPNETPSERLKAEHRKIDDGVNGLIDASGEPPELTEALALLRRHIHAEEEVLFPELVKSGLTMPVFVMKREHGQMWGLIRRLESVCASGNPTDVLLEPCRELFKLLQIHNPKEEQILYTAVDKLASKAGGDALAEALATDAMPDDWACEQAP